MLLREAFPIRAGDYQRAGEASAAIKRKMQQLGAPGPLLRRMAVAAYEAEMNLVIHSLGGSLTLEVDPPYARLLSQDIGPGIPDIEAAMRDGFSTANEEARNLGFGAGMGLSNMKRNAGTFHIESRLHEGTSIRMEFALEKA